MLLYFYFFILDQFLIMLVMNVGWMLIGWLCSYFCGFVFIFHPLHPPNGAPPPLQFEISRPMIWFANCGVWMSEGGSVPLLTCMFLGGALRFLAVLGSWFGRFAIKEASERSERPLGQQAAPRTAKGSFQYYNFSFVGATWQIWSAILDPIGFRRANTLGISQGFRRMTNHVFFNNCTAEIGKCKERKTKTTRGSNPLGVSLCFSWI